MASHGEFLRQVSGGDEDLVLQVLIDFEVAPIAQAEKAMLRFVTKLTLTPGQLASGDLDSLRQNGFSDQEIHAMVLLASYFCFLNRVADAVGLHPEQFRQEWLNKLMAARTG